MMGCETDPQAWEAFCILGTGPSPFLQGLLDRLQQAPGPEKGVNGQSSIRPNLPHSFPSLAHSPTQFLFSQQRPFLLPLEETKAKTSGERGRKREGYHTRAGNSQE